jgi:ubiquinone/menaquinone biosynthesis C-methylase UbiE
MRETPICDYGETDYQASFWGHGDREYEDRVEAIALKRLLPRNGGLMLEIGAGAGRNTTRYEGFERIVLVDYSISQLEQAQARLGASDRYIFVAADAYHLPLRAGAFDAATMIRVLHHMADPPAALAQVRDALGYPGTFILEFANKRNTKAIFRYFSGQQKWSPFTPEPVEFAALNFDFHPASVRGWLHDLGFSVEMMLTVSHFRVAVLKKLIPLGVLVYLDSMVQWTGRFWQLTPSVFLRARRTDLAPSTRSLPADPTAIFKCPSCGNQQLEPRDNKLKCVECGRVWGREGAIFDFRQPLAEGPLKA